jgi:hypothetical protein
MNSVDRRIARLEKEASRYSKLLEQNQARFYEQYRQESVQHAACLAVLIAHGNPQIDEPLSLAWQRFCEKFPVPFFSRFPPFEHFGARHCSRELREHVIPDLAGANEQEKLSSVFATAPAWLIWFTRAHHTAAVLRLKLPDLSSVTMFSHQTRSSLWPALPSGKFQMRPLSDDPNNRPPLSHAEHAFWGSELSNLAITPRQQARGVAIFEQSVPFDSPFKWPDLM